MPNKAKLIELLENYQIADFFAECEKQGVKSIELSLLRTTFIAGKDDAFYADRLKLLVQSYPLPSPQYRLYYAVLAGILLVVGILAWQMLKPAEKPLPTQSTPIEIKGNNNGQINTGNNNTINFNTTTKQ